MLPPYEPEVIERFATKLERRARAVLRGFTVSGAALGAAFGSVPLMPVGEIWPVPHLFGFTTLAVGVGAGALIGYAVGQGRAELYRLHAQTTLCQLHAQRTSLAIWRLLHERPVLHAAPPVAPAPAPEPELPRVAAVPSPVRPAVMTAVAPPLSPPASD